MKSLGETSAAVDMPMALMVRNRNTPNYLSIFPELGGREKS